MSTLASTADAKTKLRNAANIGVTTIGILVAVAVSALFLTMTRASRTSPACRHQSSELTRSDRYCNSAAPAVAVGGRSRPNATSTPELSLKQTEPDRDLIAASSSSRPPTGAVTKSSCQPHAFETAAAGSAQLPRRLLLDGHAWIADGRRRHVGPDPHCSPRGTSAVTGRQTRLARISGLHEGRSRSPTASSRASQTRHVGKHLDIRKQQSLAPRPDARIGLLAAPSRRRLYCADRARADAR